MASSIPNARSWLSIIQLPLPPARGLGLSASSNSTATPTHSHGALALRSKCSKGKQGLKRKWRKGKQLSQASGQNKATVGQTEWASAGERRPERRADRWNRRGKGYEWPNLVLGVDTLEHRGILEHVRNNNHPESTPESGGRRGCIKFSGGILWRKSKGEVAQLNCGSVLLQESHRTRLPRMNICSSDDTFPSCKKGGGGGGVRGQEDCREESWGEGGYLCRSCDCLELDVPVVLCLPQLPPVRLAGLDLNLHEEIDSGWCASEECASWWVQGESHGKGRDGRLVQGSLSWSKLVQAAAVTEKLPISCAAAQRNLIIVWFPPGPKSPTVQPTSHHDMPARGCKLCGRVEMCRSKGVSTQKGLRTGTALIILISLLTQENMRPLNRLPPSISPSKRAQSQAEMLALDSLDWAEAEAEADGRLNHRKAPGRGQGGSRVLSTGWKSAWKMSKSAFKLTVMV